MSAPCLNADDTITLLAINSDDYSGDTIDSQADIQATIDLSTGYSHGGHQDAITSDAVVFISPENQFVQDNFYRLEQMLVKIPLFGTPDEWTWYKVIKVNPARDTQLCNQIDHLELLLKKTAPLEDIS